MHQWGPSGSKGGCGQKKIGFTKFPQKFELFSMFVHKILI
jgi:hypothetical protein